MSKVDILRSDVFHIKPEENTNPDWKELSNEDREKKLVLYLEQLSTTSGKKISPEAMESLLLKIRSGKLTLKKEVGYDRINQRIIKLYFLSTEDHVPFYHYRSEEQCKKEKKNARALLFRKKA